MKLPKTLKKLLNLKSGNKEAPNNRVVSAEDTDAEKIRKPKTDANKTIRNKLLNLIFGNKKSSNNRVVSAEDTDAEKIRKPKTDANKTIRNKLFNLIFGNKKNSNDPVISAGTFPITTKASTTHSAIKSDKPAKKKRGVSFADEVEDINLSDRREEYIHNRTKRNISKIFINTDLEELTLKENQDILKEKIESQKQKISATKTKIAELQIELEDKNLTSAEKNKKRAQIQELKSYIPGYKESLKELQDINYLNVVNHWNEAHTKTSPPAKASDGTVKVEHKSESKPRKDIATTKHIPKDSAEEKVSVAPENNETQSQTRNSVILGISSAVGALASYFSPMIGIASGTITYGILKYIDSSLEGQKQEKNGDNEGKGKTQEPVKQTFTERVLSNTEPDQITR